MQDRIPKEDDNPNIEKIQNKLESAEGKNFMGIIAIIAAICIVILTFSN